MISILSRVGVSARRMQAAASAIAANVHDEKSACPAPGPVDAAWQTIRDRHQIEHALRHIVDTGHEVTLTGQGRQPMARSRIIAIDSSLGGHLMLERVADTAAHDALLRNGRVNLGSRFLDLPVVCPVDISQAGEVDGKPCYRAPLPSWMLFSEMRDSRRVRAPEDKPVHLSLDLSCQAPAQAQVIDISENGIGLLFPQQVSYLPAAGESWHGATLHTGDGEAIALELDLRHVSRHCNGGHRIGATIHPATAADQRQLHRLIVRHQRLFADLN